MHNSRADEVRAAGGVAAIGFAHTAGSIGRVHRAIADRAFGATGPAGALPKAIHDGISAGVYAAVRGVGGGVARAAGTAASFAHERGAPPLSDSPAGAVALGALSGAFGDSLDADANPLAVQMEVRERGRAVALDIESVAAAFPAAGPRVAVFTHGLCGTESSWHIGSERHYGDRRVWHGSRLRDDLGHTPVTIRVNTGLHISDNGRRLAELLERLCDSWPVEVEEVLLVGHSMGGLINRSACHYGAELGHSWPARVRNVVTLGSPHLGAPLERAATHAGVALRRLPETAPFADSLAARSVGIKDLRYGSLIDEDWHGRDPDAWGPDELADIPLLESAAHFVIGVTLTADPKHPLGRTIGDLLVLYPSSVGQAERGRRIAFELDNTRHLGGLHHMSLLSHPRVYEVMREWLQVPGAAGPLELPAG